MFEEPRDALYLLQRWYLGQCDGEWEHGYGVSIDTIDNPGWRLRVELADTALQEMTDDWSRRSQQPAGTAGSACSPATSPLGRWRCDATVRSR